MSAVPRESMSTKGIIELAHEGLSDLDWYDDDVRRIDLDITKFSIMLTTYYQDHPNYERVNSSITVILDHIHLIREIAPTENVPIHTKIRISFNSFLTKIRLKELNPQLE